MAERALSRGRLVLFTIVLTAAALWGSNALVERLEGEGVVQTHRPDDHVNFVQGELLDVDPEPHYVTTEYASDSMVPQRFRVTKGDGFRVLVSGGSFAMGTPYAQQAFGVELGGGIPTWMRMELSRRWPDVHIEVVNLAAGGQSSFRVRRIVEETVGLDADAYFVATCNNEGSIAPNIIQEELHRLGGYRLLTKILKPGAEKAERSYYTPQDPDTAELAHQFRANIRGIIATAEEAEIPLFLATLPVNLRWTGPDRDHPGAEEAPVCIRGMKAAFGAGKYEDVVRWSESCEPIADALLWRGLAMEKLNRAPEAMAALEQSVELRPDNRCRPSFNAIIREEAARSANTTLVDLDAEAKELATMWLPGEEVFHDYCHMNWRGYGQMSSKVVRTLMEAGVTPSGEPKELVLDLDAEALAMGLERVQFVGD